MRLTCPRCGAQYEIDATLIPAEGRSVQCSSCDHVWNQPPAPRSPDAAAQPRLHRPLPESVLAVLREEAARDSVARGRPDDGTADAATSSPRGGDVGSAAADAEGGDRGPAPRPSLPGADAGTAADLLWPATTLTHPTPPGSANNTAALLGVDLDAGDAAPGPDDGETAPAAVPDMDAIPPRRVARPVPDQEGWNQPGHADEAAGAAAHPSGPDARLPVDDGQPAPNLLADALPAAPSDGVRPVATTAPALHPQPAPRANRRSGYNGGFTVALVAALALLAAYALAPRLDDGGRVGAWLADYRQQVDDGRIWLQTRADGLIGAVRR